MTQRSFIAAVEATHDSLVERSRALRATMQTLDAEQAEIALLIVEDVERSVAFMAEVLNCFGLRVPAASPHEGNHTLH